MTKKKSNLGKWLTGISEMELKSSAPVKSIEVQTLEQRWELLKFELEQLEEFYAKCDNTDAINLINDIQDLMIDHQE